MKRFTAWREQPPEGYREQGAANPPDQAQFEGVVSSDGRVAVFWLTEYRSVSVWNSVEDMLAIHGHPEYGTRIEWPDGRPDELIPEAPVTHQGQRVGHARATADEHGIHATMHIDPPEGGRPG
jgi:hypothetical protein